MKTYICRIEQDQCLLDNDSKSVDEKIHTFLGFKLLLSQNYTQMLKAHRKTDCKRNCCVQ